MGKLIFIFIITVAGFVWLFPNVIEESRFLGFSDPIVLESPNPKPQPIALDPTVPEPQTLKERQPATKKIIQ